MFWYPKGKDFDVRDRNGVTLRDFLKKYNPDDGFYNGIMARENHGGLMNLSVTCCGSVNNLLHSPQSAGN